jgi:retron-type reverse transcriptase
VTTLDKVFDLKNLRRAYRWTLSNPDALYKSFFRDSYDAFALASDTHLKFLREKGLGERYEPAHAAKVLVPKPSGTVRPITLLTIEDQIVYQACINLVADALKKRTSHRYETKVFAHLYAGRSSPFFYKRWQNSYRRFAQKIRAAYADGYDYIADFDLASFYDSIDHHVLRHFLVDLKIDEDTIDFLLDCLKVWTSSTWSNGPQNIYHGHGIPQGPLPSGMLSEAVLQHIDKAGGQGRKTIYLRYVDDIKILARSELELRRKLIKLDIAAREIGLFPQTSKINIHRITDPDTEIKAVSRPPEPSIKPFVNQKRLVVRLLDLTRNGRLGPQTVSRFKFLLAHAEPTHRLNKRLMKVLERNPDLAGSICAYIGKYKKIPGKLADEIVAAVKGPELYHAVNASLIRACLGKLGSLHAEELARFAADRLLSPSRGAIQIQASYKEALIACALRAGWLTHAQYEKLLIDEKDWWVRKSALRELDEGRYGRASYESLVNRCLRMSEGEVARMAASLMLRDSLPLARPYGDVETTAKQALKVAGIIRTVGRPASRINSIIAYILKRQETTFDWRRFFGPNHRHAEVHAFFLKRNRETNIDAFLVLLDSFCDRLTSELWRRMKPAGSTCPAFGHAIKDADLSASFPVAMACFLKLHDLRLQSATAHPATKAGQPGRRLRHGDFKKIRQELIDAFDEIESVVVF